MFVYDGFRFVIPQNQKWQKSLLARILRGKYSLSFLSWVTTGRFGNNKIFNSVS
jgi:hypothetical protein